MQLDSQQVGATAGEVQWVQQMIEEHHDDVLPDEKEVRMEDFLNNTEMNMKIFFSWYYRDRGLIWYALLFILFSNISISSWSH